MGDARKYQNFVTTRNRHATPMRKFTENLQKDLQTGNAPPPASGEMSYSNTSNAAAVPEIGNPARKKSIAAYLFIAAGLLVCLVWSSALLWLAARALMLMAR